MACGSIAGILGAAVLLTVAKGFSFFVEPEPMAGTAIVLISGAASIFTMFYAYSVAITFWVNRRGGT